MKSFKLIILISLTILISLQAYAAYDICMFASSASATSENAGSNAIYATGNPDCDTDCSIWSGVSKSWNPTNWDVTANLTLNYPNPINAKNITFYGDYDICVQRIWVMNSSTSEQLEVFAGAQRDCRFTIPINASFFADSIILETCGNAWTSTDAIELCGQTCMPTNEICDGIDNDCDYEIDEGLDQDGDGMTDCTDNCPYAANQNQLDSDNDQVGDACDMCQNSRPNEDVDQYGCDIFQFCSRFTCGMDCFYADWKENEMLKIFPKDCTMVMVLNEGTYKPICFPTVSSDICAN